MIRLAPRRMGAAYNERLGDIDVLQLPVEEPWAKNVYWMYGLVLDESTGMDAAAFAEALAERGVQTRPFFLGLIFGEMGIAVVLTLLDAIFHIPAPYIPFD